MPYQSIEVALAQGTFAVRLCDLGAYVRLHDGRQVNPRYVGGSHVNLDPAWVCPILRMELMRLVNRIESQ